MSVRHTVLLGLTLLCGSCSQWDFGVKIPFVATWNGSPIDCGSTATALTDLRFYVSDPQLVDGEGRAHEVRYATEYQWQNDVVALLDLESGKNACQNGTPEVYDHLVGVARAGEYRGLRFTIGVPFRLNHANPLTASPPLDDPDMHWHWRSGYKFLRAGIRTDTDGTWIHTGSAGCEGTVGNITGCRFANRIDVFLPDFVPGESTVRIELAKLFAGTDLDDEQRSNCSSGPAESSCTAPFAALGIDFATGEQASVQRVFSTL